MSRVFLLLFIATATLAVSIACVFGATWYVKPDGTGDVATIRDAINAAADADVVLLAPGTYTGSGNYNVSFAGKAITVTSEGGPEVTIIDCQGLGRGFTFNNQEGPSSVLSGVTIRNGYAHNAGAIYIAASPTIENNILMNNSANYCAAIKIAASPEIRNNLIIGNTAVYFGGGIGMEWGTPTITGNIIAYNTAGPSSTGGRGGGIWMKFSAPIIRNNTLYGNYSNVVGGIYVEGSEPIIENNIIAFSTRGRAIWCTATAHPTLTGNAIFGNLDGDALCGIDGGGNFFLDPLLCDPANGNYYLEEGSPCIAANSPNGLLVGAMPAGCVQTGSIAVRVAAACPTPDTGLLGVEVDVYEAGSGDMFLSVETDENGDCLIDELAVGDYTVTVVMPLGYSAASDEYPVTVVTGGVVDANFDLSCLTITPSQRAQGFWKHQVGVATGGNGNAHIDAETLCSYLDVIEAHFNSNVVNQVVVYQPPASGTCSDKLQVAKDLLNLKGNVGMAARARQHLMGLLLNVASGKLSLREVVSEDGAVVSQAITCCDQLIDDMDAANDELAKDIAELINKGNTLSVGMVPLETEDIAYSPPSLPRDPQAFSLSQNQPNPFNPHTTIAYSIAHAGWTRLAIYDIGGRLVRTLVDETMPAGDYRIGWDGRDGQGAAVASGIYFARLEYGTSVETRKMILLK